MTPHKKQLITIATLFITLLTADQLTKTIVRTTIPLGGPTFDGRESAFFYFTHQQNTGLVGGIFSGIPLITYAAPILATLVLLYLYRHLDPASKIQSIAYGMVAAGAAGNLTDRIRFGHVTDFLQFHFIFIPIDFPWKLYPAFNIADTAICIGVFFLIISWHNIQEPTADAADSL